MIQHNNFHDCWYINPKSILSYADNISSLSSVATRNICHNSLKWVLGISTYLIISHEKESVQ